jgi:hypothetical protein
LYICAACPTAGATASVSVAARIIQRIPGSLLLWQWPETYHKRDATTSFGAFWRAADEESASMT